MFRSLRFRMALSHAAVLAVLLLGLGAVLQFLIARNLDASATTQLRDSAEGQARRMQESRRVLPPADSDLPSAAAIQVAVFDVATGAPVGEPSELPTWLKRYPHEVNDLTVSSEPVRVVTVPVIWDGTVQAWVSAGRSLTPERHLVERVRLLVVLGGGAGIVASLFAGWLLAGRAVRPVEVAYRAQAEFAADASHELRTPLAFIRSGVEVLAEGEPALGNEVLSEVDYLTGLSSRLLQLARAERGELSVERSEVNVADVCRAAAKRSEAAHATTLSLDGADDVIAIGDRLGIEAALDAILENVGLHGGGTAQVRWARTADDVTISVIDHGPGLPAGLEGRAFERFFRADPSRARETGGAGLGLALARTLIEAQGGRVWVVATPGGGLTALISVPTHR